MENLKDKPKRKYALESGFYCAHGPIIPIGYLELA